MASTFDQSFEVLEGGRLVVDAPAGAVRVRGGSPGAVSVTLHAHGVLPALERAIDLEVEHVRDDVYVQARGAPWLAWLPAWAWRGIELRVSVPARYSVQVQTRGGRIDVSGVTGEVEARSRSGRLVLHDIRGAVEARTASGSIDVHDVDGEVFAHTRGLALA